jgi:hypothetical protein
MVMCCDACNEFQAFMQYSNKREERGVQSVVRRLQKSRFLAFYNTVFLFSASVYRFVTERNELYRTNFDYSKILASKW